MKLGNFSLSLNVKDIKESYAFYQKLGFEKTGGDMTQNWIILKNEDTVIGLFQGMFEGNTMTFNPGWDKNAQNIDPFDDVRVIQIELVKEGIKTDGNIEGTSGPGYIMFTDPDGNQILIDQHR